MKEHISNFADWMEHRLESASTPASVGLAIGGLATLFAGAVLKTHGLEIEGVTAEIAGGSAVIVGAEPGLLRWVGILPPRQSDKSEVE